MSYLKHSICAGSAPVHFDSMPLVMRNTLLMRLMEDRGVPRIICAPSLYGKTILALQYAQTVFSFTHMSWLQTQSPCFLRDLDNGDIAPRLVELLHAPALVVFDDLPVLSNARLDSFIAQCRCLMEAGIEVVITTEAGAELAVCMDTCLVLTAEDLLFSDDELSRLSTTDAQLRKLGNAQCVAHRIAGLLQRTPVQSQEFLAAQMRCDLSALQRAQCLCMAVLQTGTREDIACVLGLSKEHVTFGALADCPHWGIRDDGERFDCRFWTISSVLHAMSPYSIAIASVAESKSISSVAIALADILIGRCEDDRAVKLLLSLCDPAQRTQWLARNQDSMEQLGMLVSCQVLYEGSVVAGYADSKLKAAAAARLCLMGYESKGLPMLLRASRDVRMGYQIRIRSFLRFLECASKEEACATAAVITSTNPSERIHLVNDEKPVHSCPGFYENVCAAARAWQDDSEQGMRTAIDLVNECDDVHKQAQILSWLVAALRCGWRSAHVGRWWKTQRKVVAHAVREVLQHALVDDCVGLAEWLLVRQLGAGESLLGLFEDLEPEVGGVQAAFEPRIQNQRMMFSRLQAAKMGVASGALQRAGARAGKTFAADGFTGSLQIYVMGGLRAVLNGEDVLLRRKKVRTLLGLLVVFQGQCLSSERLARLLWPQSDPDKAQKNLHSTWSLLRSSLIADNGTCPFLARERGTYRLVSNYVHTDWSQLDTLCRRLTTEAPEAALFSRLLNQISALCKGPLLPDDTDIEPIATAGRRMNEHLVDALTMAARVFNETKDTALALRFARFALEVDSHREDAYDILIRTQIAAGQRPAALETCFMYRDFMVEELGLDPTRKTWALYEAILNDGEI